MSKPATNEDIEQARDALLLAFDNLKLKLDSQAEAWRRQQSSQHDEQNSMLKDIRECVHWLKDRWKHFTKGSP